MFLVPEKKDEDSLFILVVWRQRSDLKNLSIANLLEFTGLRLQIMRSDDASSCPCDLHGSAVSYIGASLLISGLGNRDLSLIPAQ